MIVWKLYAATCYLDAPQLSNYVLTTGMTWDTNIMAPYGAALVPLVADPLDATVPATMFLLRARNGDGVSAPEAADVSASWTLFDPRPNDRKDGVVLAWPAGAAFALMLVLYRSASEREFRNIVKTRVRQTGAAHDSQPTEADIQTAVAWHLGNHPARREHGVMAKP